MFRATIAVYSENHMEYVNSPRENEEICNVKTGGIYSNHSASKCYKLTMYLINQALHPEDVWGSEGTAPHS
jgi:hypothetical protein